jgi:hypothetical protein
VPSGFGFRDPLLFFSRKPGDAKRRRAAAVQDAGALRAGTKACAGHRIFENVAGLAGDGFGARVPSYGDFREMGDGVVC